MIDASIWDHIYFDDFKGCQMKHMDMGNRCVYPHMCDMCDYMCKLLTNWINLQCIIATRLGGGASSLQFNLLSPPRPSLWADVHCSSSTKLWGRLMWASPSMSIFCFIRIASFASLRKMSTSNGNCHCVTIWETIIMRAYENFEHAKDCTICKL